MLLGVVGRTDGCGVCPVVQQEPDPTGGGAQGPQDSTRASGGQNQPPTI
jgi:hypothetical protein